ncbi:phosphatase PAP2 family protein [Maritimibacter sp. DP1N21-5]|uniref:phosphatase PAP2 family protein n=1 Tax=Maritimibacter sp. DP1N21-5 TaxID=2836867 RepID=UPI001C487914|nr:phosphatase PAP2 family protein [Maritimibacter sp. DP1N21-5]MBV7410925.1 phosphatase PAP2 family protein [Maritimibacter sp. DP1N21-5]
MKPKQTLAAVTERIEAATLVVLMLMAAALWAFFALAGEMTEGDLHAFDEAVLMALRVSGDLNNPIGGTEVETAMRDLTALGGITVQVLLAVFVFVFLLLRRRRGSALLLAVAVIGGQVLSHFFKGFFDRPRPDLVPHGVEVATASFPSGHSMMATVTYLTLAVLLARVEDRVRLRVFYVVVAATLAGLVGVSRVYLGVHWPSDVLAGWTLGAAWALAVFLFARLLASRGQIDPDKPVTSSDA